MQYLSTIVLALAAATTMVMADPASVPEVMATSVPFGAQATVAGTAILNRRGATVARYVPATTVGTASSATITGVFETVRPREGIMGATVAAAATVASPF